jgi:hypothetical protein
LQALEVYYAGANPALRDKSVEDPILTELSNDYTSAGAADALDGAGASAAEIKKTLYNLSAAGNDVTRFYKIRIDK